MKINRVKVGYLECNCYILEINNKVLVIDPGDEYDKIKPYLINRKVVGICITHGHFDHIGAIKDIVKDYKTKVYDYSSLEEKEYDIEGFVFDVIRTPGHSEDMVTYYFRKDSIMFTGDFLFRGTIGRCDLEGGSIVEMKKSLEKIKDYSDVIKIYPGHGDDSTLGYEKKYNPYLKM
jgi:glyoxylase-like metal-dependent hydrolase (beta-lactamase superfamily II)